MNFKKVYFLLSIVVIFFVTQIATFLIFYYLIYKLGLFQNDTFFIIFTFLVVEFIIFFLLSKELIEPIFKSEKNIQKTIKNTLHELNIPISTIRLNLDLLKDIKDEKHIKRLERIKGANENLLKLYNNMEYELKKEIEKVDLEEFYLDEAINCSLDKFTEQLNGFKVDINIDKTLLFCDYYGFIIVLDNLLSNAIKYNNKEDFYIKIEQKEKILSIYNNGISILPENIILVFERYFQENSLNKGYGIGLTVVKEFCDKYKIAINIKPLNSGTLVTLNLKNIIKDK